MGNVDSSQNSETGAKRRECCDLNTSFFGEDAFYREAFFDCEEGDNSKDHLFFKSAKEQVRLKVHKAYAMGRIASAAFKEKITRRSPASSAMVRSASKSVERLGGKNWLGKTIQPHKKGNVDPGNLPAWLKGNATGLEVRQGPNYKRNKSKAESGSSMYEAISLDAIKFQEGKIENIISRLIEELPRNADRVGGPDRSGGQPLRWERGCPLPRIICINLMLPNDTGINPFAKDTGCSVVGLFHIKPETLQAVNSAKPPAWVKLFKDFCEGPAGAPGNLEDPNRCLDKRQNKGVKKDQQSGLLKAVAYCENPTDVNIPQSLHRYNGKPCLITKSGYIVKDPNGEWLEMGVDVRRFNILARKSLSSFKDRLPQARIHYGFWIQASEDDEMPERMLCDVHCNHIDMVNDAVEIDNPDAKCR